MNRTTIVKLLDDKIKKVSDEHSQQISEQRKTYLEGKIDSLHDTKNELLSLVWFDEINLASQLSSDIEKLEQKIGIANSIIKEINPTLTQANPNLPILVNVGYPNQGSFLMSDEQKDYINNIKDCYKESKENDKEND